ISKYSALQIVNGCDGGQIGASSTGRDSLNRPLLFPVLGVAIVIAVVFFTIYGPAARPDVPLPVSATIDHFAPGIAIGSTMKESAGTLRGVAWTQHVGYVGALDGGDFIQARLFAPIEDRRKLIGDD